jgi:hypothetical protein
MPVFIEPELLKRYEVNRSKEIFKVGYNQAVQVFSKLKEKET